MERGVSVEAFHNVTSTTHRTSDGSDKVLEPGGRAVVLEAKDVLLGEGRSSEELCESFDQSFEEQKRARRARTAKDPGALRAAVHEAPRYNPKPSSRMIWRNPRERKASGLVLGVIVASARVRSDVSASLHLLALDLEDIKGKKNDLSDTGKTVVKVD